MKLTNLAFILALAAKTIAYPVPASTLEPVEDIEEDDDSCGSPDLLGPPSGSKHQHSSHHIHITNPAIPLSTGAALSAIDSLTIGGPGPVSTGLPVNTPTGTSGASSAASTDASSGDNSATATSNPTGSNTSNPTGSTSADPSALPTTTDSTTTADSTATTTDATPTNTASPKGALRGVNIGNWLVIEPWMDDGSLITGKFKSVADQWGFDTLDTDGSAIKKHWDSWFTEDDVQKLKGFGFNALRIPIGYWAINNQGTPYHKGAADYMDKAIQWARSAGMKVLIDCHGSPGSQNGEMHSGHQGAVDWQRDDNLDLSTKVLQQMVQKWGTVDNADTVYAIEIVNEPTANQPNSFTKSQSWAQSAYNAIQETISSMGLNKNLQIITHDSFKGIENFIPIARKLASPVNRPTFGVDQHDYQLYTDDDNALDQPAHIKKACGWASDLATTKSSMPVIVGEWSALTNICVQSNGKTSPSSSGKSGSCTTESSSNWSPELIGQVRRYVEAQLDVYEANSDGHFIWSFKAGGGWGLYNLIDIGAFPQPMDARKYPGQCS